MDIKKLLGIFFATAILAGCASSSSTDDQSGDSSATGADASSSETIVDVSEVEPAGVDIPSSFYFGFDQATLTAGSREALDQHIALLKNNNDKIRLEGNADERGSREYNMALGERRANAVANYMIINGIPRYRIETVSYGEERPVAFGHNDESWQQNRRVDLKIAM